MSSVKITTTFGWFSFENSDRHARKKENKKPKVEDDLKKDGEFMACKGKAIFFRTEKR
tara:strand:+ start:1592 stop:1765 length:174 start_codon:yes stop_codon:yes gene_type:complete